MGYKTLPGVSGDISRFYDIGDRARQYGETVGLGMAGRQAKGLLKAFGKGDFDTNPILASYLTPIREQGQVARRENAREAGMGANALFAGQQPVLQRRLTDLANARTDEGTSRAISEAIPALYGQASGAYTAARGQRIGAEQDALSRELAAIQAAMQGRLAGTYKTKGFMDYLKDAGQIAGGVAAFL